MSEHTKEPWRVEDETDVVAIVDQWPSVISDCLNHAVIERSEAAANARRIVACVNACAGISTDGLEASGVGGLHHLAEATFDQRMDRNALIESLATMRNALSAAHKHIADDRDRFIEGCVNRATGAIDAPEDQAAVRQYNDLLAQIEDAMKTGGAA